MKKLSTLHILNGDARLPSFEAANLPGQVLVWREVLSEGPVIGTLPPNEFWELRQHYIASTYAESEKQYQTKVLDELPKFAEAAAFFEVVLWFDADLMCQLNMLYLLHALSQKRPKVISICTPALAEESHAKVQTQQVFENRQQVTDAQLQQANELWKLYAGTDPLQLQKYLQEKEINFPYLRQALEAHLFRFPECYTGLGLPHKHLLKLIRRNKNMKEQELIEQFGKKYPIYGFGDWQIQNYLLALQPALVSLHAPYELTSFGEQVLDGEASYTDWLQEPTWLGGVLVKIHNSYCFSAAQKKLIQNNDNENI